jgi:hypothetical protein
VIITQGFCILFPFVTKDTVLRGWAALDREDAVWQDVPAGTNRLDRQPQPARMGRRRTNEQAQGRHGRRCHGERGGRNGLLHGEQLKPTCHSPHAGAPILRESPAMQSITPQQIRSSFINASRSEAAKLTLPKDFETLDWDTLDFLGWRDDKRCPSAAT